MILVSGMTTIYCGSPGKRLITGTPEVTIQLEKTGCFGTCPVYIMSIYSDRSVLFEGKANTLIEGTQRDTLSHEKYDQIVSMFENEKFADLDTAYIEAIVDAPFTYLSFRQKGNLKKVAVRGYAPDSFKKLVDRMEGIAQDARWLPNSPEYRDSIKEIIIELKPRSIPKCLASYL